MSAYDPIQPPHELFRRWMPGYACVCGVPGAAGISLALNAGHYEVAGMVPVSIEIGYSQKNSDWLSK